eukprot:TRINITY_DN1281_c0_g1_i4.p1 TRINITY_DN1281_c0_g1~~TRINITY_DN1281_c0_g1_i4.p1  ORF type:complete len:232 (-),score=16.07 TRINITY_DN1281_c0_g1_i4:62-757(-)
MERAPLACCGCFFGPAFLNETVCPMKNKLHFISVPKGEQGIGVLGGQGLGIMRQSPNLQAAKELFSWLLLPETQYRWSELGGLTTMSSIMQDYEFILRQPFNIVYVANFAFTKDLWRLPEYFQLMRTHMETLHKGMTGELTPMAALQEAATKEQYEVDKNHPCGPSECKHDGFPEWAAILIPFLVVGVLFVVVLVAVVVGALIAVAVMRKRFIQKGINMHRTVIFGRRAHN